MKIISFILVFINLLSISTTTNGLEFKENINNCYETYIYLMDEENVYGDLALVFGKVKSRYYASCYLYAYNQSQKLYLRIKLDDELTTYVPDSLVVEGYGLEVKKQTKLLFYIYDGEKEILMGEYNISDLLNELETEPLQGNASMKFPKNKKEVSLITKLRIMMIVFVIICIGFSFLLFILYKKRIGRFNQQRLNNQIASEKQYDYDYKTINDEDSFNEYMNQHQQQRSETVHETKEQIMERLFNEYRCGDISEEELDERLKNLEEQND